MDEICIVNSGIIIIPAAFYIITPTVLAFTSSLLSAAVPPTVLPYLSDFSFSSLLVVHRDDIEPQLIAVVRGAHAFPVYIPSRRVSFVILILCLPCR